MKWMLLAALAVAAGCDGNGSADGARGPCAAGGQILGVCGAVETPADACWKLVDCAVIPVDSDDTRDWGDCLDRIEALEPTAAETVIGCVAASSCDALFVNDSPQNPYEWPDCLEYP
jgi:hypothetical protein